MSTKSHNSSDSLPKIVRHERNFSILISDLATVGIPCLIFAEVSIGGRLFMSEIALLLAIPFLVTSRGNKLLAPSPRQFIILCVVWLLSQIVTDLIQDIPFEDFSRGWSRVIFFLTNFVAIYLLIQGSNKRIVLFTFGAAIGQILTFLIAPTSVALFYVWKFGCGTGITLLVILICQIKYINKNVFYIAGIYGLAGAVNFYFDYRSLGLACFMVAIFVISQNFVQNSGQDSGQNIGQNSGQNNRNPVFSRKSNTAAIGIILVTTSIAIFGLFTLYSSAVAGGVFGEDARQKYEFQSSGQLGLLLGGRTEIFASSVAIADSPIIGHGSWAKDPKYLAILEENLTAFDYQTSGESYNDTGLIPSHSYLLGAWIESGLAGTFIWFWLLSLAFRLLPFVYRLEKSASVLIIFFGFWLIWNILFSPFGATERFYSAFYAAILVSTRVESQKLEAQKLESQNLEFSKSLSSVAKFNAKK